MPAPSLFERGAPRALGQPPTGAAEPPPETGATRLLDLLFDGFYMVLLLRNGHTPQGTAEFRQRVLAFLAEFEARCMALQHLAADVLEAKFAYCALLDEVVLLSQQAMREDWSRRPLQLELFGEQLAGDRFFDRLDILRRGKAPRVQVLEVYHMCLLMGFAGRHHVDGADKLAYMTARLGEEIALLNGSTAAFAPRALPPDRVSHALRRDVPVWVMGAGFACLALGAFLGLRWHLGHFTQGELGQVAQVVQMPPPAAHFTLTLP